MKRIVLGIVLLATLTRQARADLWGGDIPLLIEIVANTLNTLQELRSQSRLLQKELRGIDDAIFRLQTIRQVIRPDDLSGWKDPKEALRRLRDIYYTLPQELRTEKSDEIERQISRAMSLANQMSDAARPSFQSGKELETRALESGPAVAQKLGASGIGTLIALESQNQVAQATLISLISQMIADGAGRENARLRSQSRELLGSGHGFGSFQKAVILPEVKK